MKICIAKFILNKGDIVILGEEEKRQNGWLDMVDAEKCFRMKTKISSNYGRRQSWDYFEILCKILNVIFGF